MGNMLKRIVYPTSTSTSSTTATSSAAASAADPTRSVIPDGFGELPVVVTPNTKAKR